MLGGIFCRWKQVVAYEFTPDGFDGRRLKIIIEENIARAENIGLRVHSVTSDMGSMNQAMWKAFSNIGVHRDSSIHNSIPHPIDCNRKLFFFADGPHLLKKLRAAIIANKQILLPEEFTEIYQLSSRIVKFSHFQNLVNEQENMDYKIAPKLNNEVITMTRFNKMKVNKAANMFSRDVSGALNFLSEERNNDEYRTTATFVEIMAKWFNIITSRHAILALGKNPKNEEMY
ncbi:THAP domain-containing protein 9 [Trachymyrmex cornetzi]|uniref:THAP domain-containing protein 9 n=1 Tax=Trachymyrmex cornetzi TaxID=471704 RepID=A0A151JC37_9HYME|nr:THAP domain-containing protein 9 [Trachymyrmex cornetzi]